MIVLKKLHGCRSHFYKRLIFGRRHSRSPYFQISEEPEERKRKPCCHDPEQEINARRPVLANKYIRHCDKPQPPSEKRKAGPGHCQVGPVTCEPRPPLGHCVTPE